MEKSTKILLLFASILIACIGGYYFAGYYLFRFGSSPKQPELTQLENIYISQLENSCNCNVYRGVTEKAKKSNTYYTGISEYSIVFTKHGTSDDLENDSLRKQADRIASQVLTFVNDKNFNYRCDEVIISYDIILDSTSSVSKLFSYWKKDLEKGIVEPERF